jgi:GT2 family glycosyltransferase
MANPKVLIASPVYEGMDYCLYNFIDNLKNFSYSNYKILIVDNSKSKKFFRKIKEIPKIKVLYDETSEEKNILRLISSRNKIIDYALENDFDYLLMMDSDVFPPSDIIERLLSHGKDCVSGLYFNIFKVDGQQKLLPVAYKSFTEQEFNKLKEKGYFKEFNFKEELRYNITKEDIEKGELVEVLYPSAGCVLLSRKILVSGIRYSLLDAPEKFHVSDDISFFKDVRKAGFKIYCDTSLICKHDILGKFNKEGGHPVYN